MNILPVITLILLAIGLSRCAPGQTYLQNSWVNVDSPEGVICHFKDSSTLVLENAYLDTVMEIEYQITAGDSFCTKENNGRFTCFGKIIQSSVDSFTVQYGPSQTSTFIALPLSSSTHTKQNLIKLLSNNAWKFTWNEVEYRLDFTLESYLENSHGPYSLIISYNDILPKTEIGYWNVPGTPDRPLLFFATELLTPVYNEIVMVYPDKLETISYSSYHHDKLELTLEKIPNLSSSDREKTISYLTSTPWKISNYDTVCVESGPGSFSYKNCIFIDDLNDSKITHRFNADGTYQRLIGDSMVIRTTWNLSRDGNVIWLGASPSRWSLKVVQIDTNHLTLTSLEQVLLEDQPYYMECQVLQSLIPTTE